MIVATSVSMTVSSETPMKKHLLTGSPQTQNYKNTKCICTEFSHLANLALNLESHRQTLQIHKTLEPATKASEGSFRSAECGADCGVGGDENSGLFWLVFDKGCSKTVNRLRFQWIKSSRPQTTSTQKVRYQCIFWKYHKFRLNFYGMVEKNTKWPDWRRFPCYIMNITVDLLGRRSLRYNELP